MDEEMAIKVLWQGLGGGAGGAAGGQKGDGQGDATDALADKKAKAVSCDGDFWLMCTVHNYEKHSMENVNTVPTLDEMISASNT